MLSNLGTLRTLVGLRYRLLWAQARTGKGRIALFLTLYLVGGGIAIFFVLGGFGAAVLAVQTGKAESLARAILSGIFFNGIVASLALGVGPRAAFADRVLRRFPLTPSERFSARHIIGILDPLWLFLAAVTLGLTAGLVLLGAGSFALAVPAALLFICVTYLVAALLLTIVERILQRRGGELLLTVIMLVAYVGFALGLPVLLQMKSRVAWWPAIDRLLQLTPAGSAAALLASPRVLPRLLAALALLAWGALLWFALRAAENWMVRRPERRAERISWDSAYDSLARIIYPAHPPLAGRALRYHLRCNRVRYQLAISVPLILFLEVMFRFQRLGPESRGMATLGFVFMLGIFSTLAMAVNEFGYDGAGVRRYPLLPLPMSTVLRAQARTSLFLSLCAIVPGVAAWCLMRGSTLDWRGVVFVTCDAMAGLLLFGAAGLWTTVLTPKRAEFDRVMGNDMSLGGNIILFACIFVMSAMGPLARHRRLADILNYWWLIVLGAAAMAVVYVASLLLAGRLMDARRERVVETIAGAAQN